MQDSQLDDARASDPVERLLEESWESRTQRANRRELVVEGSAAVLFLAVAGPLLRLLAFLLNDRPVFRFRPTPSIGAAQN